MKKRLFLVLIVCILLLTACAVGGTSGVERFKKTVQEELVEKDFHHVKETIVQKMEGIVSLKQEKQLWFCEGNFYSETVQNDNAFTYGIKYNSKGYISQTKTAEGIRWTEEKNLQSLETLNSWFLTLEQDSFVFKDEYISCEENDEGVVFTYDRSQEIKPSENEINVVKETYYFDKKWNLIKVELISEGMMSYENGQSGKLEILITTEFIGSSKKDITKKLEDVIKKVK